MKETKIYTSLDNHTFEDKHECLMHELKLANMCIKNNFDNIIAAINRYKENSSYDYTPIVTLVKNLNNDMDDFYKSLIDNESRVTESTFEVFKNVNKAMTSISEMLNSYYKENLV